jgi:hypothetical protein
MGQDANPVPQFGWTRRHVAGRVRWAPRPSVVKKSATTMVRRCAFRKTDQIAYLPNSGAKHPSLLTFLQI